MNTNKKGFTLIELLVVIVIIGILATISVATFGGYFKKARDSERQSAVQNIATIMKVLNATEETVDYSVADRAGLNTKLAAQGYSTPDGKNGLCYYYGYNTADIATTTATDPANSEFFIAVASEEKPAESFIAGTPGGVSTQDGVTFPANGTVSGTTDTCTALTAYTGMTYTSWLEN